MSRLPLNSENCYILLMNVSLTPELERRISERVESGLYTTASEVVREALRLLFEADAARERARAKFDGEMQVAIDELDRGEGIDPEESYRRVTKVIDAHRRKAG